VQCGKPFVEVQESAANVSGRADQMGVCHLAMSDDAPTAQPKKVAIVACMRKLLTMLNAMLRDQRMWDAEKHLRGPVRA
jgi:transposase